MAQTRLARGRAKRLYISTFHLIRIDRVLVQELDLFPQFANRQFVRFLLGRIDLIRLLRDRQGLVLELQGPRRLFIGRYVVYHAS